MIAMENSDCGRRMAYPLMGLGIVLLGAVAYSVQVAFGWPVGILVGAVVFWVYSKLMVSVVLPRLSARSEGDGEGGVL